MSRPIEGWVTGKAPGFVYREHPIDRPDDPFFQQWAEHALVRQGRIEAGIFKGWELTSRFPVEP